MTDLRADSMTGEQFVFDERTADPSSTQEGERWLRTDLTSGDKIATLRVDVGSSILDVPVFPVGTAEDSVVEAIRVRVGSQTGYIPAVPETNANFPALRLQHNGQVFGYHDEQGVFAFFDVAISSTNSPVEEGSNLNVDYSVVNTGFSANNTQDIRLNIDSTEEDRDTNITLSPSSSTTGTLTWTTPSSSAGTYNASVLSDDDTASTSVTVEAGPAIPDSGVLRLEFEDDVDTTTAVDSWNDNDGTINGATYTTSTVRQGSAALSFDGTDDDVDGSKPTITDSFTKMAWVNFDSTSSAWRIWEEKSTPIAYTRGDSGSQIWSIFDGSSDLYRIDTSQSFANGTWYHLAYTVDHAASEAYAYVDGSQVGSATSGSSFSLDGSYVIGSKSGTNNVDGYVDDYREYDTLLSQSEIQDIINNTS